LQEECDFFHCQFDGTDCTYTQLLYANCSAVRFDIPCYDLFKNGVCDRACNSAECLFDGWDCEEEFERCNPMHDTYCNVHYADGNCDSGCNVRECMWDGLDCVSERQFVLGLLVIVVAVPPAEFAEVRTTFLRQLGELLHIVVVVARDADGNDMIEPYTSADRDRRSVADHVASLFRHKRAASVGYVPFLPHDDDAMHSADYAVARCLSICLSVCLSHASILLKWLNISTNFFHPWLWHYSDGDPLC